MNDAPALRGADRQGKVAGPVRLTLLASGSGGNALLVEAAGTALLIDGGLRPRKLRARRERLYCARPAARDEADAGLPTAVFLTHEHADHVCGAAELAAHGLQVYATAGTARALPDDARRGLREVAADEPLRHGAFAVRPLALPHDANEPVAYVLEAESRRLGVLTDCGHPSPRVAAALAGCDALVLEANHDAGLLAAGPYPPFLKRRIAADHGHLSNDQSAALLRAIMANGGPPGLVIAAHLSRTNNRPELVAAALRRALGPAPTTLLVTPADGGLPTCEVPAAPGRAQLAFAF